MQIRHRFVFDAENTRRCNDGQPWWKCTQCPNGLVISDNWRKTICKDDRSHPAEFMKFSY